MRKRLSYSGLGAILSAKDLSVSELGALLERRGTPIGKNTLYRLAKADPIDRIDLQVLGALRDVLEVSLDELLIFEAPATRLQRLPAAKERRLHELMAKNSEGKLSKEERNEFFELGREAERITLANARQLAAQRKALQHT